MITGVYYPEINGAVLQCKQLISNMCDSIHFTVLTGTDIEKYDGRDCVEGVSVTRVSMPKRHKINYIIGGIVFFISLYNSLLFDNSLRAYGLIVLNIRPASDNSLLNAFVSLFSNFSNQKTTCV